MSLTARPTSRFMRMMLTRTTKIMIMKCPLTGKSESPFSKMKFSYSTSPAIITRVFTTATAGPTLKLCRSFENKLVGIFCDWGLSYLHTW